MLSEVVDVASPRRPSRYIHPEQEGESVQIRAAERYARRMGRSARSIPERLCRHCAVPLSTGAEYRLGIHVWCVYEIDKKAPVANIPRPRYAR